MDVVLKDNSLNYYKKCLPLTEPVMLTILKGVWLTGGAALIRALIIDRAVNVSRHRLHKCIHANDGNFEHAIKIVDFSTSHWLCGLC